MMIPHVTGKFYSQKRDDITIKCNIWKPAVVSVFSIYT